MEQINLQQTILRNLLTNDEYARKVAAFVSPEYFEGVYRSLFKEFTKFIAKYNKLPSQEAFKIEVDAGDRLTDEEYRHAMEILPNIFEKKTENIGVKSSYKSLIYVGKRMVGGTGLEPVTKAL